MLFLLFSKKFVPDTVLEWDFLSASNAVIDCHNSKPQLDTFNITDEADDRSAHAVLRVDDDLVLPPRSTI